MANSAAYNDLIFQLGDLARERLGHRATAPRSMARVLRAEQALLDKRSELQALEAQLNSEDAENKAALLEIEGEQAEQRELVARFKKAVEGAERRSKELRKKLAVLRTTQRIEQAGLVKAEAKHAELAMSQAHEPAKIDASKQRLKQTRLIQMRRLREVEETQAALDAALTPSPDQPGAEGVLAFKRLIELDDELQERAAQFEGLMGDLDAAIVDREKEITAAEDFLDQAIFLLGEACYQDRIADPALAALYLRLDRTT